MTTWTPTATAPLITHTADLPDVADRGEAAAAWEAACTMTRARASGGPLAATVEVIIAAVEEARQGGTAFERGEVKSLLERACRRATGSDESVRALAGLAAAGMVFLALRGAPLARTVFLTGGDRDLATAWGALQRGDHAGVAVTVGRAEDPVWARAVSRVVAAHGWRLDVAVEGLDQRPESLAADVRLGVARITAAIVATEDAA